jgi:hypothetical protein
LDSVSPYDNISIPFISNTVQLLGILHGERRRQRGRAVIAMMFLFNGVIGSAFQGLVMAYTTEILPYHIRAKGVALC